ncbi:MAG: hypothetical protein ACXVHR_09065 [Methanobacterium sp.]
MSDITNAIVNINKAIIDFEDRKDFEKVNELKFASSTLKMTQKIIQYGLLHD